MNRRRFLLAAAGLAAAVGGVTAVRWERNRGDQPADPHGSLWVPPLAAATREDDRLAFDLDAQPGRSTILPGYETDSWGFNSPLLGPTLRARRGDRVTVRVRNRLSEPTTVHWHGMRLPASSDGGPHQLVAPGDVWTPSWRIDQPAATLWYHPHPHEQTEAHLYRGLGGIFIVDDDREAELDLPRDYGVDDIPLIVQDKSFDGRGNLEMTGAAGMGKLHDTVVVNGTVAASFTVTTERTRLRILNASTSRTYSFGLSDGRAFDVIAGDGGLLTEPVTLRRVILTPGERAEIVVTMDRGEVLSLRSYPHDITDGAAISGSGDELHILRLVAAETLRPSPPTPRRLIIDQNAPSTAAAVRTRRFEMGVTGINGKAMDRDRIDEIALAGSTEIWEVSLANDAAHNFHIHGVQFRVLDIDGNPPPPEQAGWKDTVYTPYRSTVRLLVPFPPYGDPDTPYMYHCHLVWHEDLGMMGQYLLVDDNARGTPAAGRHHH